MTVELWLGEEFEYGHEMSALSTFLQNMVNTYGQDEELYLVLANFMVDSNPIDLAVVKHNNIMAIELKEVGQEVTGGENGPWTMIGYSGKKVPLKGGSHGNPYLQARSYRFALIDFLGKNQQKFLKPRAGQTRLDQIAALVALSPVLPSNSKIDLPPLPWFKVVGLDRLHLAVFQSRSSTLKLTTAEMRRLVKDTLRLRQVPLEKYILVPTKGSPANPPATHPDSMAGSVQPPLETVSHLPIVPVQVRAELLEAPVTVAIPCLRRCRKITFPFANLLTAFPARFGIFCK